MLRSRRRPGFLRREPRQSQRFPLSAKAKAGSPFQVVTIKSCAETMADGVGPLVHSNANVLGSINPRVPRMPRGNS
jgi:hypothetical protein